MWTVILQIFMLSIIGLDIKLMTEYINIPKKKQSLPSRGLNSSTITWNKEKTARDVELWQNDDHFWIIQNNLYDLTNFIDSHPGGSHWLTYTKGQDITELFITQHLNENKVRALLQKYYVRQAKVKQQPRYTFQPQGLFRKVKEKVLSKYKPQQLQNNSKSVRDGSIFISLFILSFLAMAYYQSFLLAMLCGALIYPIIGVAHNFIHMKNHPFRFLWSFTGFSHQQWQKGHCISHHVYANTLIDYQIQALEPLIYYLKVSPKNTIIKWMIKQLVLSLTTLLNILLRTVIQPLMKMTLPDWLLFIPLIQIPIIYLITYDLELSSKLFATIHVTFSIIMMKLTFLGHRTGVEWTEGNTQIKDFAQHQIYASSETPTQNCRGFMSYLLYAGFNYHAIHHLFPTVDNYYLPQLTSILQQQAHKKGIKLNKHKSVLSGLLEIQKNFFNRKQWKRQ